ncbi:MAG: hypothetical protein U0U67_14235 [Chitinophagales bacterium]
MKSNSSGKTTPKKEHVQLTKTSNTTPSFSFAESYFLHYFILFFGAILLYGWTTSFDYNLDDQYSIGQLTNIDNTFQGMLAVFKKMYVGLDYRPIPILSFWFERFFFGSLKPGTSHLMNTFIFGILLITIYRFVVVSRFYEDEKKLRLTAFITAIIFLVHPNHVSVVANIKSRDNLFSMLFGLLSAIQFIKLFDDRKWWRLMFIFLFLVIGFMSKLDCYMFLLAPLLVIFFYREIPIKKLAVIAVSTGVLFLIVSAVRDHFQANAVQPIVKSIFFDASKSPLYNNDAYLNRISMACITMLYYLKFLVVPFGYYFYYGYNQIPLLPLFHPINFLAIFIYASIGLACLFFYKKNKIYLFSFLFFLLGIAYASNLPQVVAGIIMDRYDFIASLGFCLAISALLIDLTNIEFRTIYKNVWLLGLIIILSFFTVYRTSAWKDQMTLFQRDIPHLQKSFNALKLISGLYMEQTLSKARRKSMHNQEADFTAKMANKYADQAIAIFDNSAEIWQIKGIYDLYNEDYNSALKKFQKCKNIDSNFLAPINYIGVTYQNLNRIDSAKYYYKYVMEKESFFNYSADNLIEILKSENQWNQVDSIVHVLLLRFPADQKLIKKAEEIQLSRQQPPFIRAN